MLLLIGKTIYSKFNVCNVTVDRQDRHSSDYVQD